MLWNRGSLFKIAPFNFGSQSQFLFDIPIIWEGRLLVGLLEVENLLLEVENLLLDL